MCQGWRQPCKSEGPTVGVIHHTCESVYIGVAVGPVDRRLPDQCVYIHTIHKPYLRQHNDHRVNISIHSCYFPMIVLVLLFLEYVCAVNFKTPLILTMYK